jgi:hypothetical protein
MLAAVGPYPHVVQCPGPVRTPSGEGIIARNPFDSEFRAATWTTDTVAPPAHSVSPDDAPPCPETKLLVVAASEADPDWSFAALSHGGQAPMLVRRSAEFAGRRLVFVGGDRAFLENDEGLCQVRFGMPSVSGRKEPAVVPRPPTESTIEQSLVEKLIEDPASLGLRATPSPTGVVVAGIRKGSPAEHLGLERGDLIESINGFEIGKPEQALEAYARLRTGVSALHVRIRRGGKPLTLDVDIR